MSTTHQSAWRSKAIDFLECSEQFTVAFGRGQCPSDSCGDGGHGGTETQSPVEFADEVQPRWEGQRGKEAGTKVEKLAHSMASNSLIGKSASFALSTAEVIALPRLDNSTVPSVEQWASRIRSLWANGTANTLELARIVCQARQAMRHGTWAPMWRCKQLPFAKSKADMLVRIGERLGDLDAQTFGHLPGGWSILYSLSLLGLATVKRLIEEGIIHPRLTWHEARELLAQYRGERPKRLKVGQRLRSFREFGNRSQVRHR